MSAISEANRRVMAGDDSENFIYNRKIAKGVMKNNSTNSLKHQKDRSHSGASLGSCLHPVVVMPLYPKSRRIGAFRSGSLKPQIRQMGQQTGAGNG